MATQAFCQSQRAGPWRPGTSIPKGFSPSTDFADSYLTPKTRHERKLMPCKAQGGDDPATHRLAESTGTTPSLQLHSGLTWPGDSHLWSEPCALWLCWSNCRLNIGLVLGQPGQAQLAPRPLPWCRQNVRLLRGWADSASEGKVLLLLAKGQLPGHPACRGPQGKGGRSCRYKQQQAWQGHFLPQQTIRTEQKGGWV